MGEATGIEWTEKTWNPWHGCTRVSPGCAHCYMFREKKQYGQNPELVVRSKTKFREPLRWKEPALVFTCSWSDWFHETADAWRDEAWDIIRQTPHLTYQILTKRPERILAHLPRDWGANGYVNVWLGVSVENQRWVDRAAALASVPARVRFISAEPLLGPIDLEDVRLGPIGIEDLLAYVQWVIVGGESGPKARPMELDWVRKVRDQCARAGVAFFLKQLGGWPNKRGGDQAMLDGQLHTQMPGGWSAPELGATP